MQKSMHQLIYSPSDLITYMESPFDSWMNRYNVEFPGVLQPDAAEAGTVLLQKLGNRHEAAFLEKLKKAGRDVKEISGSDEQAQFDTILAMRQGHDVIYQAVLSSNGFFGKADFLFKVDGISDLGPYHYQAWDTKLARQAKPYFIIQLCCYCELLAQAQGRLPDYFKVVLGDFGVEPFRTIDYIHYYRQLKKEFLTFQQSFRKDEPPQDCRAGDFSRWRSHAEQLLEQRDDLSRVANIRQTQIQRLKQAGINTVKQLVQSSQLSVAKMAPETFSALKAQARLQIATQEQTSTAFELLPALANKGLSLLPPASVNDVFFDMEGYPHVEGGLEYLFGAVFGPQDTYRDWWAHDRDQEKQAFESFVDWVYGRWLEDPGMHIYHYAPYEVSALRRLAGRYATRVEEIDNLLRQAVFVDIYQIVRQSVRVGQPSYSIKYVEHLYRPKRQGQVSSAVDSVVSYERWLEMKAVDRALYQNENLNLNLNLTQDVQQEDQEEFDRHSILQEIGRYNQEDCLSTRQLTDWLRERQRQQSIVYTGKLTRRPPEEPCSTEPAQLARKLLDGLSILSCPEEKRVQELLAWLLEFHVREDKPMWWRLFERQKMTHEELADDLDCLGGLCRTSSPGTPLRRNSTAWEYSFDADQDTKLQVGDHCKFAHTLERTTIEVLDRERGLVALSVGAGKPPPDSVVSIVPDEYVNHQPLVDAIYRLVKGWSVNGNLPQALDHLLFRKTPQLKGQQPGSAVTASHQLPDVVAAISAMDKTCLCIQGPPGTGKTYTASNAIVELIKQGKRVGITSNSHKAIENLLEQVGLVASRHKQPLKAIKIGGEELPAGQGYARFGIAYTKDVGVFFKKRDICDYEVVAGTAWLFSNQNAQSKLDYLFIDEAGQVSLAHAVAMSQSAHNIVLLGDQMQLEQPVKGAHPKESGLSCLDYLLQDKATIPPEFGIFLAQTQRMHSRICQVISDAVYESRLFSSADTDHQSLIPAHHLEDKFRQHAGLVFVPVTHQGNTQGSDEEADAVKVLVEELRACQIQDREQNRRPLLLSDILIVTPYNMQARKILSRIPGARIASVDKFQGQEAHIVILSMCASDGNSSPRGMEFLFSPNRLNVAISRARTLAFVVASPALVQAHASTLANMHRLSFYCQIVSAGSHDDRAAEPALSR